MKTTCLLVALFLSVVLTSCETAPLESPKASLAATLATAASQDSSKITAPDLFDIKLQQPGGPKLRDTVRLKIRNLQPVAVNYQIQLRTVYPQPVDGLSAQYLGALETGVLAPNDTKKLTFSTRGFQVNGASQYRAEVFTKGIYFGDFAVGKP